MIPILFNTEMVQAIKDGRKTMTRRIVKLDEEIKEPGRFERFDDGGFQFHFEKYPSIYDYPIYPPVYEGDILYVRETWKTVEAGCPPPHSTIVYRAGGEAKFDKIFALPTQKGEWKPSIFMPKDAARIFLKVKQVRCERMQDMTVDDVKREGIDNTVPSWDDEFLCNYCPLDEKLKGVHCYGGEPSMCDGCRCDEAYAAWVEEYKLEFAALWDSTLSKDALEKYGWAANPWVWVIEFEKLDITSYEEAKKLL